jgi:hypothetical protein
MIRVINYPLVLTGNTYGKHFILPAYRDYHLRVEQQIRFTRPKYILKKMNDFIDKKIIFNLDFQ